MNDSEDDEIDFIDAIRAPKPRTFKTRINYLQELDDQDFHKRFRVTKESFKVLCDLIRDKISPSTNRYESVFMISPTRMFQSNFFQIPRYFSRTEAIRCS
jgi:hypothetical protein